MAAKAARAKHEMISLNLSDEARLDNACNLSRLICKTKRHLADCAPLLRNVFAIVLPDWNDDKVIQSEKRLLKDCKTVSVEDIAASDACHCKWAKDPARAQRPMPGAATGPKTLLMSGV